MQIAHDAANDDRLLRVLLPEVRALRAHDVEQLHAHRRDAAEVAGTRCAFGAGVVGVDPCREARRVHLVLARRKEHVDALGLRDLGVACLVVRIGGEVGRDVELRGVDEERGNHELVLRSRRPEERAMAVVQRAHRRYEADRAFERKLCGCPDDLHVASASVAPASVS